MAFSLRSRHALVALIGLVLAGAGGSLWLGRGQPPREFGVAQAQPAPAASAPAAGASAPRAAGVEVAKVVATTLVDESQAVGTLRSRQSVMLRPEVAGRVTALGFADGARVRRGQMLVQLDDRLQLAELQQAQAQLAVAEANHRRNQELVAQKFVAQRVLDESAAALQVAQAQRALAEARLARMRIVAPFDGVVGLRNVNVGDYVKDGADLVNLEDLSTLLVDFRLPERDLARLRVGQPVRLELDALPGRRFEGRVEAVDPLVDANGRAAAVRASLPNTAGQRVEAAKGPAAAGASAPRAAASAPRGPGAGPSALRPGMFARVNVVFGVRENALVVPEEAVVPQAGKQFVIKVVEPSAVPGTATAALSPEVRTVSLRQEVQLGLRRQGKVEIRQGVQEGDTVVVAGQQRLQRDGTPVRIVEGPRAAAR